jgi:hypothetical protein
VREETIWSLGRLRAFASWGGVNRVNREMEVVIDAGNDTEVGLNCGLEEALGVEDIEEVVGRESLGVAEARMANSIAICATAHSQLDSVFVFVCEILISICFYVRRLCDEK